MSDNFKAFKDARNQGKSTKEAAFETWTGRQAQKLGYNKIKVISEKEELILIEFIK